MSNKLLDRLIGLLLLVLAGALYWGAGQFPVHAVEAARYVRFLALALAFFSLLLLVVAFAKAAVGKPHWFADRKRFFFALITTLLYVWSMSYLGFYISTALYVPITGWILGFRRPLLLIITTAVLLLVLWGVFEYFLAVPVPRPTWR